MDDWQADLDVEPLDNGKFAPVLVLTPPHAFGPPIRRRLEGEYDDEELARMAILDAAVKLTHRE